MTSPNNDPWARTFLEGESEDPDQQAQDPHVPDSWYSESGFLSATRLNVGEDQQTRLADYQDHPTLRAELKPLTIGDSTYSYLVLFAREKKDETS